VTRVGPEGQEERRFEVDDISGAAVVAVGV